MAPGPPLSDAGLPARRGGQTAAVAGGTPAGQDAAALLPLVGARAERRSAVHLQRHVEALPPGRRQEGWAGDPHSRPVPHHEPPEQGDRRGPGPGSAGLEGPGPGADPHAYPLALAQAPRAPHGPARGAPGGAPPVQPQGGPRLSLEGRLPVLLALHLAPLGRWCTRTLRSRIAPMQKVARMLRAHRTLLLNWFRAKGALSSGAVEGFNNKARVTTRRAYGFRTFRAIEVALYHTLGALPEPDTTHRFC